ncbi:deazaflavin-dependent oxidoreductase (nitroreductase family) [Rhodococcus sp. OK611]|uniref:nitroreductase family deazaflavin-dependent oxidoreductase n=1 Tax=unclassified Rhodococcus (in: high G+C Gram-positive bacteria) TaxID=192944 RepID=UPI000BC6049B|nr:MULTISPECIES: nitroreductase family deazaflavin-dependent oxidoreductase [unclassified Rhodococcus (in: high G+C Gram-positive bacteria)]PTR45533.1 deazaflavin-dependent oxidoreductase (nitroreductase family) [Rhodococcus sp. OK611]SNX89083.1 deazaflavin-dependent oxidoreductase, nitroreductase family [Rhodococcus sp. OK270]
MKFEEIPAVKKIGVQVLKAHQWVYERTNGRIGHRILGVPCLLLDTVGAKTGQARVNSLTYVQDGRDYVVVAPNGGAPRSPGWYFNLRARPDASVRVGTTTVPVTARLIGPEDADYARLFAAADANNGGRYSGYQRHTDRPIPLVVLTPR